MWASKGSKGLHELHSRQAVALSTMELLCSTVVVVMAFSALFGRQP
jgi:hypothetical protein